MWLPRRFIQLTLVALALANVLSITSAHQLHGAQPRAVCKSFHLCHNSKGLAWTSIEVFQALEGLFDDLALSPMSDYVDIVDASGSTGLGCSCATPVEVQLTLPASPDTERLVEAVSAYVAAELPKMAGTVCLAPLHNVACIERAVVVAQMRRRLSEAPVSDDVVPAALTAGMVLAPEEVPAIAAALNAAPEVAAAGGGGGGYGYGYGGYYGYGYYGDAAEVGATELIRRSLFAEGEDDYDFVPFNQPAHTTPAATAAGALALSASAAERIVPAPVQRASGLSCSCRFDPVVGAWQLFDLTCRSALYAKCGAPGGLLECTAVDAYFTNSHEAAQAVKDISAFLFLECPPPAPCACRGLALDGSDSTSAKRDCCANLWQQCKVPFSGLRCADVDAMCGANPASAASAAGPVKRFVAVKTYRAGCSDVSRAQPSPTTTSALAASLRQRTAAPLTTLVVTVLPGLLALAVALCGVVLLVQHLSRREQGQAQPLLSDY